jgi:predicted transcriptional regulator YheO
MMKKELKKYVPIANLIAKTFGKNCEVIIHDLSTPKNSVVYTVNNHITGREIGQSFDHLVKQVLLSKKFNGDYVANYLTVTADGREIKSSTALLKDLKNNVIGALCVNCDLESMKNMKVFLDEFLAVEKEEIENDMESFGDIIEMADHLIDRIIASNGLKKLKRKDKIELIRFMEQKGIFLIKGAIEKVAEKLDISKVTVYSYLDEIKKSQ